MDPRLNPLEERPFVGELGDALRDAVARVRTETPPAASLGRAIDRARRLGPGKVNPWLRYHRIAVAAAVAAVLMLTFGLLLVCWRFEPNGSRSGASAGRAAAGDDGGASDVAVGLDPAPGRAGPGSGDSRSAAGWFADAEHNPVSTFPLTVDAAAYGDVRRALLDEKRLPAADAVRVADLVNSFTYSYPEPSGDDPVSLTLDLAECPWNAAHHLARIGVRGRADAAARDASIRVTFNPRRVAAYRLIGYEGRYAARGGAGETLAAGRAVTALYEIVPARHADKGEWLTTEFRCQDRTDRAWALTRSLSAEPRRLAEAPDDFRFAAAAAQFGLLLRESAPHGDARYAAVKAAAHAALGVDPDGRRTEFLSLVDAAERLAPERRLGRGPANRG